MRQALKYKNKKLRKIEKKEKLNQFFTKTLTRNLNNKKTSKKFKLFNFLKKKESSTTLCVFSNKSRNINRVTNLSGTSFKLFANKRQLAGFKKGSW